MKKSNSIVEMNGTRYDARTGQVLGQSKTAPKMVDGIVSANHNLVDASKLAPKKAVPTMQPLTERQLRSQDISRPTAKHAAKHQPQASKTLMRSGVKKPASSLKSHTKVHSNTQALVKQPARPLAAKPAAAIIDMNRHSRAQLAARSQSISRFHKTQSVAAVTAPVPISELPNWDLQPAQQLFQPTHDQRRTTAKAKTTADVLQQAIEHANSHEQELAQPRGFKNLGLAKQIGAVSAVLVVSIALLALITSQSMPGIKMQMASSKAGFSASLPNYSPAGFRMSDLSYSPGTVSITYQSNSDQRSYSVVEKNSAWNSQTLHDTFVSKKTSTYQTVSAGGQTIYVYGNGQATWVNAGVWYQVASNGSLTDRQLVSLAVSM